MNHKPGTANFSQNEDATAFSGVLHLPMRETVIQESVLAAFKGMLLRMNDHHVSGDIEIHVRYISDASRDPLSDIGLDEIEEEYDDTEPPPQSTLDDVKYLCPSVYLQRTLKGGKPGFSYVLPVYDGNRIVLYSGDLLRRAKYPVDEWKLRGVGAYPLIPQALVAAKLTLSRNGQLHWVVTSIEKT